jgi:hypothetical protein
VPGLHARDTRRVYEELLGSAERSVLASTYAFFDGPKAFEVLARRMDERPALRVTLLLNVQRRRGDTTAAEQLVRRFADQFWKSDWPGTARPRVFYDPRALDPEGPGGVLHAKAVVADEEAVCATAPSRPACRATSRCLSKPDSSARYQCHDEPRSAHDQRGDSGDASHWP